MIWLLVLIPTLFGLAIWIAGGGRWRTGVLGTTAAGLTFLVGAASGGETGHFAWSGMLAFGAALPPLAQAVALTVPAVALAVLLFAAAHEPERGLARLVGLSLIFVGAMELVVIADDLIALLIGWELMGACSWALIGHEWRSPGAGRSANYAFLMTRAGDLGLFLAVFVSFSAAGSTTYESLGRLDGTAMTLAATGILIASASKAGLLPFAPWLFRAMAGPTAVSALLHSATMVAAGVYLLARLHPVLAPAPGFGATAIAVGLTTALLGGVVALRQLHAKKVLAGSTSAQMGLMIAVVGAGYPAVAVAHLIVHAATKSALFLSAGIAHRAVDDFDLRNMRLGRKMPLIAVLAVIAALSLAAVPPFAGGWSKEEMINALAQTSVWVGFGGIIAGALSAAYATRFAWLAFGPGARGPDDPTYGELAALSLLSAGVLMLSGLWWSPAAETAAALLQTKFPEESRLWLIVSLSAVGVGLLAGLRMARNPGHSPASDWLGLPVLIDRLAIRPFEYLARQAARMDDSCIDRIPGAIAWLAHRGSSRAADTDNSYIDGLMSGSSARPAGDTGPGWRGAVSSLVQVNDVLTRFANSRGEALSDLIAEGTGRAVGMAGSDFRRVQSGFVHHYYATLIAGTVFGMALLVFGA